MNRYALSHYHSIPPRNVITHRQSTLIAWKCRRWSRSDSTILRQKRWSEPFTVNDCTTHVTSHSIHRTKAAHENLEDEPTSLTDVLTDANPSLHSRHRGQSSINPSQRRLAKIIEISHSASLLHDDVIDEYEIRRGRPSAKFAFSSKMLVQGGDFMLGRASVALARLRQHEVIELLATVIANLIEGHTVEEHYWRWPRFDDAILSAKDISQNSLTYIQEL